MKKLIAIVLALISMLMLVGCNEPQSESVNISDHVLKAWEGEFSEEKLIGAIHTYQKDYTNIILEKDKASSVSFETDCRVSSCSVVRLARTDDTDMNAELKGYIDLFVETNCDGRKVTISTDWWYSDDDSWVNDYPVWSYLIRVIDMGGNEHYYYFRTDYSAFTQANQ